MVTDNGDNDELSFAMDAAPADGASPPLRLIVGLGDPEREQSLLPAFGASGEFIVLERCLAAEHLLASARRQAVDVVLVAFDLHRMTEQTLSELARIDVPCVVLVPGNDQRWDDVLGVAVPLGADASVVIQALHAAVRGDRMVRYSPVEPTVASHEVDAQPAPPVGDHLAVIAVTSGHGSPGRTLVALNLAVALGAVAPTVLVDLDLGGPSLAAYLDADPTRNLSMLAHAEPASPHDWERALAEETQPLGDRSPHGVVLCGVPKPEMRGGVPSRFFSHLIGELRSRYQYVVLDVGADLLVEEMALHRLALAQADQILFVGAAHLVGLWHARQGLRLLREQLGIHPERIALVVNRHDRRFHHSRLEIEWALGLPAAALIPEDHPAVERALLAQQPLVLTSRGRAARILLDLAGRIHGGQVVLPPEPSPNGHRRGVLDIPIALSSIWRHRTGRPATMVLHQGVADGHDATPAP